LAGGYLTQLVDRLCQIEILRRQSAGIMRYQPQPYPIVANIDIRMVLCRLGQFRYAVHKP